MAGTSNIKVIKSAFKNFGQQVVEETGKTVDETIFDTLDEVCKNLLLDAVVRNRRGKDAHQYTGNLINSIVVILHSKPEGITSYYFAYDDLKAPIRKEMSAMTSRGNTRKNAVHFRPDWQGTPHSSYRPTVVTDGSTGPQDARAFAASWKPETGLPFEICVAYTSEYAEWVEKERQTTGYLNSVGYTRKLMKGLGLKQVS